MKFKIVLTLGLCLTLATACQNKAQEERPEETESVTVVEVAEESLENESTETSSAGIHSLPEGIVEKMAETEKYPQLEQLIIREYEIPESYWNKTKYYYNAVDLNDDGKEELFVVVIGPYTSGTGGSSAMIVYPVDGELHVNQQFTLINTPVIISDTLTNGAKEIIVYRSGGGADSTYVKLTCKDGYYTRVNDGEVIESLQGTTGKAIIANDLLADMEQGGVLLLGE